MTHSRNIILNAWEKRVSVLALHSVESIKIRSISQRFFPCFDNNERTIDWASISNPAPETPESDTDPRMSGLAPKRVWLAQNWDKSGTFSDQIQYILVRRTNITQRRPNSWHPWFEYSRALYLGMIELGPAHILTLSPKCDKMYWILIFIFN